METHIAIPAVFETPISPEAAAWARSFAAAASLAAGADEDCADNVRLAVSEIVSIVAVTHPSGMLHIDLIASENAIVMTVTPWPTEVPSAPMVDPWVVITSIADDVTVAGNSVTIRCGFSERPV